MDDYDPASLAGDERLRDSNRVQQFTFSSNRDSNNFGGVQLKRKMFCPLDQAHFFQAPARRLSNRKEIEIGSLLSADQS
jgi:hypothetical protein